MNPIAIIIAMPTGAGTRVVPGAGTSTCSDCGKKVSIAPSTVALMNANHEFDYRIKCLACAREKSLSELITYYPLQRKYALAHYELPNARRIEVLLNGKHIEGICLVADERHGFCVCVRPFSGETYIEHGHVQIIDHPQKPKPRVTAVRNFFRRPGA